MTILLEVIISVFPTMKGNVFFNAITSFNYPILKPFKILQNKIFKNNILDFSPLFAVMILSYIRMFLNAK
ncbi:YggT family protein [Clostridium lamae]|uniref:YggT family protein n=1 Tax=Clostridium TaxID=1485 RepID=UPI00374E8C64